MIMMMIGNVLKFAVAILLATIHQQISNVNASVNVKEKKTSLLRSRELSVCDTLKACYLMNIKTREEFVLDSRIVNTYMLDPNNRRGYSIRCDINHDVGAESDFIKFIYDNRVHEEFGLPRYMYGDSGAGLYINRVQYLSTCGRKTVIVEGHIWSAMCFSLQFDIDLVNSDGTCDVVSTPVDISPTKAPAISPRTVAPTKVPTTSTTKVPTTSPTKVPTTSPTKIPITPSTVAPVQTTNSPVGTKIPTWSPVTKQDPTQAPTKSIATTLRPVITTPTKSPAQPSPIHTCDALRACYIVNITSGEEYVLYSNFQTYRLDLTARRGYSIRCDLVGYPDAAFNYVRFQYDGIVKDEYGSLRYMGGDSYGGTYINKVPYLSTCGRKTVIVELRVWSFACYSQEFVFDIVNSDGSCDRPTIAPIGAPTKSPVLPITSAPLTLRPTGIPTTAPTNVPVSKAPTSSPLSTKAPVSLRPTGIPTTSPTKVPLSKAPTSSPLSTTKAPVSLRPTGIPTTSPTNVPVSKAPTSSPLSTTKAPLSLRPTGIPITSPTDVPFSKAPTSSPLSPVQATRAPVSPIPDPVCDTLMACYLVDLQSRTEMLLDGADVVTRNPTNSIGYSVRCDMNNDVGSQTDSIIFMYDDRMQTEFGLPRYMNGDENGGTVINPVPYFETCGAKTFSIEINLRSSICSTQEFVLFLFNSDGTCV